MDKYNYISQLPSELSTAVCWPYRIRLSKHWLAIRIMENIPGIIFLYARPDHSVSRLILTSKATRGEPIRLKTLHEEFP